MGKRISVLIAAGLLAPLFVQAISVEDLKLQIQSLIDQISDIQSRVASSNQPLLAQALPVGPGNPGGYRANFENVVPVNQEQWVYGGQSMVTMNVLRFIATSEDMALTNLRLQIDISGSSSAFQYQKIYIYDGATLVKETSSISPDGYVDITLNQSGPGSFIIPKDFSRLMTIKADIAPIALGQPGIAGELLGLDFASDARFTPVHRQKAFGLSSGVFVHSSNTADATGNGVVTFRALPQVTYDSSLSTNAINGEQALIRFKVKAVGGDIELNRLTFAIATSGITDMATQLPSFRLYSVTHGNFVTNATGANSQFAGVRTGYANYDSNGRLIVRALVDNTANYTAGRYKISAGSEHTFELRGTVTDNATAGGTIVTTFEGDDARPSAIRLKSQLVYPWWKQLMAKVSLIDPEQGTTACGRPGRGNFAKNLDFSNASTSFIWSDLSSEATSATNSQSCDTADWMNGYKVPGLASTGFSHVKSFGQEPVIPPAPTNLTATSTGSSIILRWTDNSLEETGYLIERSTTPIFDAFFTGFGPFPPNTTSFEDTYQLSTSTLYYYRVKAMGVVGSSLPSTTVAIRISNLPPPPPARPQCSDGVDNDNDLTVDSLDTGCHTDGDASDGDATYVPSDNNEADSSVRPLAPTALWTFVNSTTTQKSIKFAWRDNSDNEKSFLVTRRTETSASSTIATVFGKMIGGINLRGYDLSFIDVSAVPGVRYYYSVRAVNDIGSSNSSAELSAIISTSTPPPPTPPVQAVRPNGGEVWTRGTVQQISWTGSSTIGYGLTFINESTGAVYDLGKVTPTNALNWTVGNHILCPGPSCTTMPDGQYRLKVIDAGNQSQDMSNGPFTLVTAPPPPPPAPAITCPTPAIVSDLKQGSEDTVISRNPVVRARGEVTALQDFLWQYRGKYPTLPVWKALNNTTNKADFVTGFYGDKTVNTVKAFQETFVVAGPRLGDPEYGKVLAETRAKILERCSITAPKQFTVTRPSGGEVWRIGSAQDITWSDSLFAQNSRYTVYVLEGSATHGPGAVAGEVVGAQRLSWRVGDLSNGFISELKPGKIYYVQVVRQGGIYGYANSLGGFTVENLTPPPPPAGDTTPPTVSIVLPKAGERTVTKETVFMAVGAHDNSGPLSSIVIKNETTGTQVQAQCTLYGCNSDIALALGENIIRAVATDPSGNSANTSIVVNRLQGDTTPPVITFALPKTNPVTVSTNQIVMSASITDDGVGVDLASPKWLNKTTGNGGGLLAGYGWVGVDKNLAPGINEISYSAMDLNGNTSEKTIVVIYQQSTSMQNAANALASVLSSVGKFFINISYGLVSGL